ncbi:MAG: dihydropteroate synthase [Proteobacteria bacterium]|nr:dihydropteroate synthase [Pseudomonadota bacterium]NOG60872.1 dihydropteroate synthase [Pseudomonadota bacterium]
MNILDKNMPLIMGILNVTPDSFSDGGKFTNIDSAVNHGKQMIDEGADIIDIGGESTRPGSKRVNVNEQIERVVHIIKAISETIPDHVKLSIDTTRSKVADAALDAGAHIVNDVSGGNDDPEIINLCADKNCPYIIMHMQGTPETMQNNPAYEDVVSDIKQFLENRIGDCIKAGINEKNIIIDPGIGFGKTREHNLTLLKNLNIFVDTGHFVLLGTSRKRFMGSICVVNTPDELIGATTATTALGVEAGVKIFRVHDVRPNRQAADVAWTILNQTY